MLSYFGEGSVLPTYMTQKSSAAYDGERELLQTLNQESILKFGNPITYYRLTYNEDIDDVDYILGENNNRQVYDYWEDIMVWYKISRENRMWTKFGIESSDTFKVKVPKAHFLYKTDGYFPQVGDIFIEQASDRIFEVLSRDESEESKAYLQSQKYNWEIVVQAYTKQEFLDFSDKCTTSKLYELMQNKIDVLDVTEKINSKKERVIYKPTITEQASQNPYASW